MRKYMAERRARRRQELVVLLGGQCARVGCGVTENLDFDHVDAATKNFVLSGKCLDQAWSKILEEAQKCQLLCRSHHQEKTVEAGEILVVDHGGGKSGKKNCPCKPCKTRKAEYMKAYGHPSRVAQLAAAPGR
jgi:hypothetical protein